MKRKVVNDIHYTKRRKTPVTIFLDADYSSPYLRVLFKTASKSSIKLYRNRTERNHFVRLDLLLNGEYMSKIFRECQEGSRPSYNIEEMFCLIMDMVSDQNLFFGCFVTSERRGDIIDYAPSFGVLSRMIEKIPSLIFDIYNSHELPIDHTEMLSTNPPVYADYLCRRYPDILFIPKDPDIIISIVQNLCYQVNASNVLFFIIDRVAEEMMADENFLSRLIHACKPISMHYKSEKLSNEIINSIKSVYSYVNPPSLNGVPCDTLLFVDKIKEYQEDLYPILHEIISSMKIEMSDRLKLALADYVGHYALGTSLVNDGEFMERLIEESPECCFMVSLSLRSEKSVILKACRHSKCVDWRNIPKEWFNDVDFCYSLAEIEGWSILAQFSTSIRKNLVDLAITRKVPDAHVTLHCGDEELMDRLFTFPQHIALVYERVSYTHVKSLIGANPNILREAWFYDSLSKNAAFMDGSVEDLKRCIITHITNKPTDTCFFHYIPSDMLNEKSVIENVVRFSPYYFPSIPKIILEGMDDDFLARLLSIDPKCGMSSQMPLEFRCMAIRRDATLLDYVEVTDGHWMTLWQSTIYYDLLKEIINDDELLLFVSSLVRIRQVRLSEDQSNWIFSRDGSFLHNVNRGILMDYDLNMHLMKHGLQPHHTIESTTQFILYLIERNFKCSSSALTPIDKNHDIYKSGLFLEPHIMSFLYQFQNPRQIYNNIPYGIHQEKHEACVKKFHELLIYGDKLIVSETLRISILADLFKKSPSLYHDFFDKDTIETSEALINFDCSLENLVFSSPQWRSLLEKDSYEAEDIPRLECISRLLAKFPLPSITHNLLTDSFYQYMAQSIGYVDVNTIVSLTRDEIYSLVRKRFETEYPSIPFYIDQ